ncbi:MAG: hypothetical protein JWP12_2817 [Bacteroidetes bacterium]|nr:hypothetical protein [Bacteroidota bacterium]
MKFKTTYKHILKSVVVLLLLHSTGLSYAQGIIATAKLDSNSILIGEQRRLELKVQFRADNGKHLSVRFPEITDTLRKEVEVVSQSKIDTIINKNDPLQFTLTKTLYITSFDSGYWALAPFKFTVNNDTNGVFTDPLLLQVSTVAVDTTQAIKEIKGVYEQTYTFIDWLKDNMYVVYIALAAILMIIIVIVYVRKYRKVKPPVVIIEAPKVPPHIIALGKLEQLKGEKLWQEGKLKLYYSSLTDILREYIENRFKIQALEQTTDEILYGFRNVAIDDESKTKLKQVLGLADLVKFAKEQPMANENEGSLNNVYDFVNGTKKDDTDSKGKKA